MNKRDIIKFATIFVLFVFYHFIYIYYNQASTINGDTIWAYSFSRDIIEGVDIKEFSFPPLYYFLDILVSFLPSLFGNLVVHSLLVSPINVLILIIFLSKFYNFESQNELLKIFFIIIISTLITYYSNIFLSYIFSVVTNTDIYPLILLNNYFYVPGNHGLSAVIAVLVSYFFYFRKNKIENRKILYSLVFIFSFSDLWFAVYFLPIIGFFYLFNINKKILIEICLLTAIAFISLLITYYTNSALKYYKLTKVNLPIKDNVNLIEIFLIIYFLPGIIFFYLIYKKKVSNFVKCLFYGSLVSFLFIIVTQNYSLANLRYSIFILPLCIILICEFLKLHLNKTHNLFYITLFLLVLGISQITTFNITDNKIKNKRNYYNFEDEIKCMKKIPNIKNYAMVADYWAGKIIMESLDRKVNWIGQSWMYNPAWARFNETTNNIIIVKFKYYPDNVYKELKDLIINKKINSKEFCKSKLILIKNFKMEWKEY